MNWPNGFFLLWAALTGLYVVSLYMLLDLNFTTFKPLWKPRPSYGVDFTSGVVRTFDTSKPEQELRKDVMLALIATQAALTTQGKTEEVARMRRDINKDTDNIINRFASDNAKHREQAWRSVAMLAVPPLVLLILGGLTAWILQGFRLGVN
jgi:hypothetical protein